MTDDTARTEQCTVCKTVTRMPVVIRVVESSSGPGAILYACPTCAPRHLTRDEAWRVYIRHAAACAACKPWPCETGQALVKVWRASPRTPDPAGGSLLAQQLGDGHAEGVGDEEKISDARVTHGPLVALDAAPVDAGPLGELPLG